MKMYEQYKASGIPWINAVPAHWGFLRAKNMFEKQNRPVRPEDETVTCFRDGMVTLRKNRRITGFTESTKESGYQGIRMGDLVIHVMDAFAGAIGVSDSDGKSTPVYNACTPKGNYNNNYYAYLLREMARTGYIQSLYRGIRERSSDFRFDVFGVQFLPIPSRNEQDHIVSFLDWKASEVNHFIREKRKEIKLLDELKKSIISKAVTQGLQDGVPMKESIFAWGGQIPESWDEVKVKRVLKKLSRSYTPENELLICSNNGTVFPRGDSRFGLVAANDDIYQGVAVGDLLIHGMDTWHGAIAISGYNGKCTSVVHVCDSTQNMRFIAYYLRMLAFKKLYKAISNGVRQNTSDFRSWSKAGDILIAIPPRPEQDEIADFLDQRCQEIESLIIALKDEISRMVEYRACLISDVVTGKVDVRDIEVPAYEAEEEPVDEGDASNEDELDDTDEVEVDEDAGD